MGDTIYGEYAVFMTVYVLLDVITDVGVTQTFGRFVPELKKRSERSVSELLHSMLFYGVLITLLVVIFGEGGIYLFGRAHYSLQLWILLALLLIITKIEGTMFAFIYGDNQIARYSMKELIRSAATFVLVLIGFVLAGLNGALWALLASELCLLAAALFWTKKPLLNHGGVMPPRRFGDYLLFGAKFYVPMLAFSFIQRLGDIFIKMLTGSSEQVAYFDVANQYLLLTGTFLGLIFTTLLPSMTALYLRSDHDRIVEWNRRVMLYCGVVVVLTVNALALAGKDLIMLALGAEYGPVYPAAMVISLALPAVLIGYAGTNFALLEKSNRAYLTGVLGGLAALAAGCYVLVPKMAAVGAAWASVAAYSVLALVFCSRYWREFSRILPGLLKAMLPGLVCLPFWFAGGSLWLRGGMLAASSIIYLGLLVLLGIISPADIKELLGHFSKTADR